MASRAAGTCPPWTTALVHAARPLGGASSRCTVRGSARKRRIKGISVNPLQACKGRAADRSICRRASRRVCICSASNVESDFGDTPGPSVLAIEHGARGGALAFADALWRFSRPHTIWGTTISILSVSLLAVPTFEDFNSALALGVFQALFPALLMNVSIVGLNQLTDIEIDKVNKPTLPLACGDLTPQTGRAIVWSTAAVSLGLGLVIGSMPLLCTLAISLMLGIVYSVDLPFLRWKRFPFLAAACIFTVRAVLVQLGFFLHITVFTLGGKLVLTRSIIFATLFMCFCSIVIALFKDVPDVKGDRQASVKTLSVRLGVSKVFKICRALLLAAYGAATMMGFTATSSMSMVAMVSTHVILAVVMWRRSLEVDMESTKSLYSFYMFIWKLFYAEYLVLPMFR